MPTNLYKICDFYAFCSYFHFIALPRTRSFIGASPCMGVHRDAFAEVAGIVDSGKCPAHLHPFGMSNSTIVGSGRFAMPYSVRLSLDNAILLSRQSRFKTATPFPS